MTIANLIIVVLLAGVTTLIAGLVLDGLFDSKWGLGVAKIGFVLLILSAIIIMWSVALVPVQEGSDTAEALRNTEIF